LSNQDSFINEVSEEVRRDRLYALYKKYGWIALAFVILVVAGAAFNEWRKASIAADAQAAGDALLSAFEISDPSGRAETLATLDGGENPGRAAILSLAEAGALVESGNIDGAVTILETLAIDPTAPRSYQDLAALKSVIVAGSSVEPDARISRLNGLVQSGGPFALLALEQIALAEIDAGRTEDAIETLGEILADAQVSQDLRQRASQLMVSLGAPLTALAQ